MTRLIPEHDARAVESSQVTAYTPAASAGATDSLVRALEGRLERFAVVRRVSLCAVAGASGGAADGTAPGPAEPSGSRDRGGERRPASGRHHDLTGPAAAPVGVLGVADTPEQAVVRPIGQPASPNGETSFAEPVGEPVERSDGAVATVLDLPTVPLAPPSGASDAAVAETPDDPPVELTAQLTAGLWAEFHAVRSRHARDRLVVHYRGLVRGVAGRMAGGLPSHVDVSDLVQVGMFGLLDAVERFDPAREVRFESYAAQRIRGAMLDELRAQDWVPRGARARRREVERTRERLEAVRGRSVADREIAAELRISLRELRGALQHRQLVSVEALEAGTPGPMTIADLLPDDTAPDPVVIAEHAETVRELVGAVGSLGDRDRQVVRLYYLENRTLAEIGRMLGVTESRVCQLHTRLVTRLRSRLAETAAG